MKATLLVFGLLFTAQAWASCPKSCHIPFPIYCEQSPEETTCLDPAGWDYMMTGDPNGSGASYPDLCTQINVNCSGWFAGSVHANFTCSGQGTLNPTPQCKDGKPVMIRTRFGSMPLETFRALIREGGSFR